MDCANPYFVPNIYIIFIIVDWKDHLDPGDWYNSREMDEKLGTVAAW